MRKLLSVALLQAISLFTYSQSTPILPVKLPELLPPTPDAAALIKVGMGSVNYSTGAVSASISIHEIKLGNISLPVSFDYSSQGTKVEEPCTRVGAGWALNAGGVISRSVIGRPDELAARPVMPTDLTMINNTNYYYFKNSANDDPTSTFDTQPDEFRFSFYGISGKFVLDGNGNAVLNAHANLKVQIIMGSQDIAEIIITNTDGTKFYFGADGAYETTIAVTNMRFKQGTKTAFYLTKIELLSGDKIDFFYSPLNTRVNVGLAETMVVAGSGEAGEPICNTLGTQLSHTTNVQSVEYRTCKLSSIIASNGQNVIFSYENRNDPSNEVILKSISVSSFQQSLKFYKLTHYIASVANSNLNGRFFLTKLTSFDTQPLYDEDDDIREKLDHIFEYEDMNYHFNIYGQDYWGFAKGGGGNTLIPPIPEKPSLGGANREPNSNFSKKGVLKRIIYPTGGIEEFQYEANTISVEEKINSIISFSIEGRGQAGNTFSNPGLMYYHLLQPLRNQDISITMSAIFNPAGPGPTPPDDNTKTMFVTVTDATTGAIRMNDYINGTQTLNQILSVVAGHEYSIKMEVRGGDYMLGRTTITYDTSSVDRYHWVEKEAGGIRVKRIIKTDPVTGKTTQKCYTYRSLDDPLKSSGVGSLTVSYHSQTLKAHYVTIGLGLVRYLCYSSVYSANSVFNLFRYDNSHISYKSIIESDDEQMTNGGTEHIFYTPVTTGGGGWAVWGPPIPNMPLNTTPNFNGLVQVKRIFDNNKKILIEETSEYEIVASGTNAITGVACRENFVPMPPSNPIISRDFDHFSVTVYVHSPMWRRLKSIITKKTDVHNNEYTQTKEFGYGTPDNVEVKSIRAFDSKGIEVLHTRKHSSDFAGTTINNLMISKNIIAPVIEETISKGQQELVKTKVLYKDWFGDGKIIQPEFIQAKESPGAPLANKVHFAGYDASGNVTEVEKMNDLRTTYLWDYKRSAVIAEIKNASVDKVAYTSFETDATGNWTLTNPLYHNEGITGKRSYSGTLSKSFVQPINGSITLWSKSPAVTMNGFTSTALLTRNGWSLHKWVLTNAASVTIVGTYLDEVRLLPQDASMITFTHKPVVGIESKCDPNNDITYYEYDHYQRLQHIRDADRNIIKKFCYTYAGQQEQCIPSLTPVWRITGDTRCASTEGVVEQKERDINVNSPTYDTERWVFKENNCTQCPGQPNWVTEGSERKCVKNPDSTNTGEFLVLRRNINPCSLRYNEIEWQSGGNNCVYCPKPPNWVNNGSSYCETNAGVNTGYVIQPQVDLNNCSENNTRLLRTYNTTACPLPCNSATCSGPSRKCINGICEIGIRINVSTEQVKINGVFVWKCTYRFKFSDGSMGPAQTEYNPTPCYNT